MKLKILSWNIWVDSDIEKVFEFIKVVNPDIMGLQEVKDGPGRNIIDYLEGLGYQSAFSPVKKIFDGKQFNDGPAVFSKLPIQAFKTHVLSNEQSRVAVEAHVKVEERTLRVFSTHLIHVHQKKSLLQEKQVENLIKALPKERVLVMGDFNATPESEAIRKIGEVLENTDPNLLPTWSMYPEGCDTCKPQNVDKKLDYIFASRDLLYDSFKVCESGASDHLPIMLSVQVL